MRIVRIVLVLLSLLAISFAQSAKTPKVESKNKDVVAQGNIEVKDNGIKQLTAEEKEAWRAAQLDMAQGQLQMQAGEKQFQTGKDALNRVYYDVYTSRKIVPADVLFCDGPDNASCQGLKPRELKLVPLPKHEVKSDAKTEEKK